VLGQTIAVKILLNSFVSTLGLIMRAIDSINLSSRLTSDSLGNADSILVSGSSVVKCGCSPEAPEPKLDGPGVGLFSIGLDGILRSPLSLWNIGALFVEAPGLLIMLQGFSTVNSMITGSLSGNETEESSSRRRKPEVIGLPCEIWGNNGNGSFWSDDVCGVICNALTLARILRCFITAWAYEI